MYIDISVGVFLKGAAIALFVTGVFPVILALLFGYEADVSKHENGRKFLYKYLNLMLILILMAGIMAVTYIAFFATVAKG